MTQLNVYLNKKQIQAIDAIIDCEQLRKNNRKITHLEFVKMCINYQIRKFEKKMQKERREREQRT